MFPTYAPDSSYPKNVRQWVNGWREKYSASATGASAAYGTGAVALEISKSTTVADLINIYAMEKDSTKAKQYQMKLVERIGFILNKAYGQGRWIVTVEFPGNIPGWSTGA